MYLGKFYPMFIEYIDIDYHGETELEGSFSSLRSTTEQGNRCRAIQFSICHNSESRTIMRYNFIEDIEIPEALDSEDRKEASIRDE